MDWSDILGRVLSGIILFVTAGILGFGGWLWKKSIYGSLAKLDQKIDAEIRVLKEGSNLAVTTAKREADMEIEMIKSDILNLKRDSLPRNEYTLVHVGCQERLHEKIQGVYDWLEKIAKNQEGFGEINGKLKMVIDRQSEVIQRLNAHIEQHAGFTVTGKNYGE